jgi:hypothetical protein
MPGVNNKDNDQKGNENNISRFGCHSSLASARTGGQQRLRSR